jgi:Zn-dependent protease
VENNELIQTVLIFALPVLFAITLHEAAHGYAAKFFGDDTAWKLGRVTLNPMNHIDWVGTIVMPLVLYFATSGALLFGYAKPVPVRFGHLRHPKRDMIWVALAGPAINFFQAVLWGALLLTLGNIGIQERFFLSMCQAGILVNVVMFVFNLFPIPPLDGGRIVVGLLPWKAAMEFSRIEPYGFFVVMFLVMIGAINKIWMQPLMDLTYKTVAWLLSPLNLMVQIGI